MSIKLLHSPLFYASIWYAFMLMGSAGRYAEAAKDGAGIFAILYIFAIPLVVGFTLLIDWAVRVMPLDWYAKVILLLALALLGRYGLKQFIF